MVWMLGRNIGRSLYGLSVSLATLGSTLDVGESALYIQIIKYTLYMTNLTFQKEGSQFHWMYDLINEFYTQPYSVSPVRSNEVQLLQSHIRTFFFLRLLSAFWSRRLLSCSFIFFFTFNVMILLWGILMPKLPRFCPFDEFCLFFFSLSQAAFPPKHSTFELNDGHAVKRI